ncbi:MAG: hypothetical protein WCK95_28625 [Alphaproteobacteria bacterium]|jgi:hypothetical protein
MSVSVYWVLVLGVSSLFAALSVVVPVLADPLMGYGDRTPNQSDASFYLSFAKPLRDQALHTSRTGSWVLETDTRTKLAYPRIVDLAHGSSDMVNGALTAIHGRMIRLALENDRVAASNRGEEAWEPGSSIMQTAAKVTYFSDAYLSIVEVGVERTGGTAQIPYARAITIDAERGTILGVEACGSDRRRPMFKFGNVLSVCTEARLATFRDLWKAHALELVTRVQTEILSADLEVCRPRALAYIGQPAFSLYLTDVGLAIHNVWSVSNGENQCVEDVRNPFNPVIIPYRKLESLMRPGSLRDELLRR